MPLRRSSLDTVAGGCEGDAMDIDVLRYAAFTDDPASGNPAGVVVHAGQMSEPDMLGIAAEVGYSETAFVTESDPQRGRYTVRYFSPRAEVPFCGHATIATAVEIARRARAGDLVFHTMAGEVPVHTGIKDGRPWATLTSVPARSRPAPGRGRPGKSGPGARESVPTNVVRPGAGWHQGSHQSDRH